MHISVVQCCCICLIPPKKGVSTFPASYNCRKIKCQAYYFYGMRLQVCWDSMLCVSGMGITSDSVQCLADLDSVQWHGSIPHVETWNASHNNPAARAAGVLTSFTSPPAQRTSHKMSLGSAKAPICSVVSTGTLKGTMSVPSGLGIVTIVAFETQASKILKDEIIVLVGIVTFNAGKIDRPQFDMQLKLDIYTQSGNVFCKLAVSEIYAKPSEIRYIGLPPVVKQKAFSTMY